MLDFILRPWHLLVLFLASQLDREQQRIVEYLEVENQVLREKLGKGRILLNDDQRRRLAVKAKALGRRALAQFEAHCHGERNHQGLGNNLIEPGEEVRRTHGKVVCRNRLGGMLRYYYRQAA